MSNPVIWFEILGEDGAKLREFYGDLFDWKFNVVPEMDYGMSDTGSETGIQGGVGTGQNGASWAIFYIQVEDVQASLDKVAENGGKIIVPYTEVPDMVKFGVFEDPEGHKVGLVQSAE